MSPRKYVEVLAIGHVLARGRLGLAKVSLVGLVSARLLNDLNSDILGEGSCFLDDWKDDGEQPIV
jgi:hypothetical protein